MVATVLVLFLCRCATMTVQNPSFSEPSLPAPSVVVEDTVRWLERAVIGLNLCPFAKGVHGKGQIHYVVSTATEGAQLLQELARELKDLAEISPEKRDTTLLMAPACFPDFLDFNDFLEQADALIDAAIGELDRYYPVFQFVMWGGKSPAEALTAAMVETAGEA